jgi:16S rRNA (uracil1498-N3)-methyltransferase
MARFFVKTDPVDLQNGRVIITGSDVNHITNVLRASRGDTLVLCDGAGTEYDAVIEQIFRDRIETVIRDARPGTTEPPIEITLLQGVPRADKMEFIIQKSVELGIRRIIPVLTARSVVRLGSSRDAEAKSARWNRIAMEAAKQCNRGMIPEVHDPVGLDEALKLSDGCGLKLFPYEEEKEGGLRKVIREYCEAAEECVRIAILIGPEGGFDRKEAEKAIDSGFIPVTLGPRILRTETAGIAVTAIVMYELGDLGGR